MQQAEFSQLVNSLRSLGLDVLASSATTGVVVVQVPPLVRRKGSE